MSYYDNKTTKYAAGFDDFYLMIFCIVVLTGLRAGVMDHVLAPLASHWGVSKAKDRTRFGEQGWMLMYYSVFWPVGMHLYSNSKYFLDMEELWTDWPQREIDGSMKAYILGQWSFWIQQILVINVEERRKDHWQMLTHHFGTVALLTGSYAYHQTRFANLILILMDVIDLFLPAMMVVWFTVIVQIMIRMLRGKRAEDVRSNSEAENTNEGEIEKQEHGYGPAQPEYQEECDAQGIDWKARERRTGVIKTSSSSSSSSSVSFPSHRDRKELLNRIGCENKIE
ncbi:hypothetical protein EsDP_00001558 [Epichloe bromicola]|uniref:TLC domain-containing protein n=1 Tax=Epichloe bromicola TaxID=79588 RepID=A0ABQ0CI72_9HYPO